MDTDHEQRSLGSRWRTDPALRHMIASAEPAHGSADAFGTKLRVFSTTPPSKGADPETYLKRVVEAARWSEAVGCEGTLVYTDNGLVDPWLVSQAIIQGTARLCPLVAIQPVYMHPYTAAKMVASLAFMHDRRVWLNIVAGGFTNDLTALGDETDHDTRYDRAAEYAQVMLSLLRGEITTVDGAFYRVKNLRMTPRVPQELEPGLLMSGSSAAGFAAARAIGAVPVKYPRPPGEEEAIESATGFGVRIGIIARETEDEAWMIARRRFPEDRKGQIAHNLAMQVSDSSWHHQLSGGNIDASRPSVDEQCTDAYWLVPFKNYKTFCPYFVGSYDHIAELLARYVRLGARTFILDVPPSEDELRHAGVALQTAAEGAL